MADTKRRSPYQGLIPFDEEDAPFFFGREKDTRLIIASLFATPLTLLYGASGVGKSSILRAGVQAQIRKRGDVISIVFGEWQNNPLQALKATIAQHMSNESKESKKIHASSSLTEQLVSATQDAQRIFIILDQFEEYFLYHPAEDQFSTEFPQAVTEMNLPVSFLVSIREDSLAKLDRFEGSIPGLFDNLYRLEHLDRQAATDAIIKPVEQYNALLNNRATLTIERNLVDKVIDQVKIGQVVFGQVGRGQIADKDQSEARVETPYLQMVMERLWDEEERAKSHVLQRKTLDRLGGAGQIVRTHLDLTMAALPWGEQNIAAQAFHYLVTPSGTKIAHSVPDLAEYVKLRPDQIAPVLAKLSQPDTRILRPIAPLPGQSDVVRYEIFHDVLAPSILDWRTRHLLPQEPKRSYEKSRFLIVCGGTGRTLIKQRRVLGMEADLQIDVRSELESADDMRAFRLPLDNLVGTVPLLLEEMKKRTSKTGAAAKNHAEFLAEHWPHSSSLQDGVARSPAIASGLIKHPRNAEKLQETLSSMITEFARPVSSEYLEFWIISSTAGGTGEGTHRFVGETLARILRPNQRARLNFIRIGAMTYRSLSYEMTALNTFFGVAADSAFALKLPRDYPSANISTNWFYLDLPDVGTGHSAKPTRDKLIETATRALMLDELSVYSLCADDGKALIRIGYWGRDWDDNALYYPLLTQLIKKLNFIIQPDYSSLMRDAMPPEFRPGQKLLETLDELGDERKLYERMMLEGWKFPRFERNRNEEDMLSTWTLAIDHLIRPYPIKELAGQSHFEVAPQSISGAFETKKEILAVPWRLDWVSDDWYESITKTHKIKAWVGELERNLNEKLFGLAEKCSSIQHNFLFSQRPEAKSRELAGLLPDLAEALVQHIILRDLERSADHVLETQLIDSRTLLTECTRQESVAKSVLSGMEPAPVISAELSDKIDPLQYVSWLRLLVQAFQQGGTSALREETLRGAVGLKWVGLLNVLELDHKADVEVIKRALRERTGRMYLSETLYEAQWWQGNAPLARRRFSYRIFPRLEPDLKAQLGTEDQEILYSYAKNGELGLKVLAFEGASLAQPSDTVTTPTYLLIPFVEVVREILNRSDGQIVHGKSNGKLEIASAGAVGDPLYKEALQSAGLTTNEMDQIAEFYQLYSHNERQDTKSEFRAPPRSRKSTSRSKHKRRK